MLVNGDHHLVHRQLQLAGGALHDADVGLVRNEPVDVGLGALGLGQHRAGGRFQHADGELEHGLAVHLEQRVAQHLAAGHGARHAEDVDMATIGMQVGGDDARRLAGRQHHGAGAVAEQHAGGAISEVEDAREHLGADHQRVAGGAGADHRVGHRQAVDEARTHRLHVERRAAVGDAQLALHDAGRAGEDHVRRGRGDDDQPDVLTLQAGSLDGVAGCLGGQVARRLIGRGKVTGPDAGALDDPVIGRLDALGGQFVHQVLVAQTPGGQCAAGAGDAAVAGDRIRHAACRVMVGAATGSAAAPPGNACRLDTMRSCTRSSRPLRAAS